MKMTLKITNIIFLAYVIGATSAAIWGFTDPLWSLASAGATLAVLVIGNLAAWKLKLV